jgi:hypothetical protein
MISPQMSGLGEPCALVRRNTHGSQSIVCMVLGFLTAQYTGTLRVARGKISKAGWRR